MARLLLPTRQAAVSGLIVLTVLLTGCASRPPVGATPEQKANSDRWSALKAKLDKMTPHERAAYLQAHPDEVQALSKYE